MLGSASGLAFAAMYVVATELMSVSSPLLIHNTNRNIASQLVKCDDWVDIA